MTGHAPREIKTSQPLKPCSFCGGDVGMLYIPPHTHLAGAMPDHPGSVHIECVTCEYVMHGPDEPTLTARWNGRADDPDEAYEIGKHEGYERAVQVIDIATGGDGEYKGSTIPGETVDSDVMQARIIERCRRADVADEALAVLRVELDAALGHLLNALIDLETGAPKQTAINTLAGGINRARAAGARLGRGGV